VGRQRTVGACANAIEAETGISLNVGKCRRARRQAERRSRSTRTAYPRPRLRRFRIFVNPDIEETPSSTRLMYVMYACMNGTAWMMHACVRACVRARRTLVGISLPTLYPCPLSTISLAKSMTQPLSRAVPSSEDVEDGVAATTAELLGGLLRVHRQLDAHLTRARPSPDVAVTRRRVSRSYNGLV
jgi:hypothetical protein